MGVCRGRIVPSQPYYIITNCRNRHSRAIGPTPATTRSCRVLQGGMGTPGAIDQGWDRFHLLRKVH